MAEGIALMAIYYALVHYEDGSAFGVTFPDLPGCYAAADEEESVFGAAQAALSLYATDQVELPAARSLAQIKSDAEIAVELKAGAFLIAVPLIEIGRKARFNVMLSTDLVEGVDKFASGLGISRSEFLAQAIGARLESATAAVIVGRNAKGRIVSQSTSKKVSSAASKVMSSKSSKSQTKSSSKSEASNSKKASPLTQKTKAKKTA